jgi:hypothetical protein
LRDVRRIPTFTRTSASICPLTTGAVVPAIAR